MRRIATTMNRKLCKVSVALSAIAIGFFAFHSAAAPNFSEWSAPVNLGPLINSPFTETGPTISRDGLRLYIDSTRPGGFGGGEDIWVSRRASRDDPWGPPVNLGPKVNSSSRDFTCDFSPDGHLMFFSSTRPGGFGNVDIWVSRRADMNDDFGWEPPVNLGAAVNSDANDGSPHYFENEDGSNPRLFFSSNRSGLGGFDTYVSAITPAGTFSPAVIVPDLSSPLRDARVNIRRDGLEVFFTSDRTGSIGGSRDLWVAKRERTVNAWSTAVNLGPMINSQSADEHPSLSSDGQTLFFASDRPGGFGESDIYMTRRISETLFNGTFYFAQAGGGGGISTAISLTNPSNTKSVSGTVSFFGADGRPLEGLVANAVVPFTIPPAGGVTTSTNRQGSVRSGYACVVTSDPVFAKATYLLPEYPPLLVWPSTPSGFAFFAPVSRALTRGVEAAVAVVNVSSEVIHVVLSAVDSQGKPIRLAKTSVTLAPGEQLSRSLADLLPALPADFSGTLRVTGLSPLPSKTIVVTVVHLGPGVFNNAPLTVLSKATPREEGVQ